MRIVKDLDIDLQGRDVLLVEDIELNREKARSMGVKVNDVYAALASTFGLAGRGGRRRAALGIARRRLVLGLGRTVKRTGGRLGDLGGLFLFPTAGQADNDNRQ